MNELIGASGHFCAHAASTRIPLVGPYPGLQHFDYISYVYPLEFISYLKSQSVEMPGL